MNDFENRIVIIVKLGVQVILVQNEIAGLGVGGWCFSYILFFPQRVDHLE